MVFNPSVLSDPKFWVATITALIDTVFGVMVAFGVGHFTDAQRLQLDSLVAVSVPVILMVWMALHASNVNTALKAVAAQATPVAGPSPGVVVATGTAAKALELKFAEAHLGPVDETKAA